MNSDSSFSVPKKAKDVGARFGNHDYTLRTKSNVKERVRIEYFHVEDLPKALQEWCFRLVESNMRDMYVRSDNGWVENDKREELTASDARYLVAYRCLQEKNDIRDPETEKADEPIGFVMFQFTFEETMTDEDIPVAYCYEIQLIKEAQGGGLGKHLITLLERIGSQWSMEKVMLTVFKENTAALSFYIVGLGYSIDEISPSVCVPEDTDLYDYEILSKRI